MSTFELKDLFGYLGFLFSIFVFVITRIENRKKIVISITESILPGKQEYFGEEPENGFLFRVVNTSTKVLNIDSNSLKLYINGKESSRLFAWRLDNAEGERFCLTTGKEVVFGIELEKFYKQLSRKSNRIKFTIKDIDGKKYTKAFRYALKNYSIENLIEKPIKRKYVKLEFSDTDTLVLKKKETGCQFYWAMETRINELKIKGYSIYIENGRFVDYQFAIKDPAGDMLLMEKVK